MFRPDLPEIAVKVGVTPLEQLRWLVEDFAAQSFCGLPAGETPQAALEAGFFLAQRGNPLDMDAHLPAAMFQQLVIDVRTGLDNLLAGGGWKIRVDRPLDRTLYRATWERRPRPEKVYDVRSQYFAGAPESAAFPIVFQLAAMDLVYHSEPWRLARCANADCSSRFVRKDKRQEFCCTACGQALRTKRYRTKKAAPQSRKEKKS